MKNNRRIALLLILLATVFVFSAVNAQEPTQFAGAWPYQVPPNGHLNLYATNRIDLGIYQNLRFPEFAIYKWATGEYEGLLADSWGYDQDNNYVLTLKSGVMWSDGAPVTAQDVVSHFNIQYLLNATAWQSISKVEAVDDLTVKFTVTAPSNELERLILIQHTYPSSVYGDFGARAQPLVDAGTKSGDAEFDALLAELTEFRPETEVASGPYVLDPSTINDANITLKKNAGGLNADLVKFDEVLVWNGETEVVTPLVSNGDVWYATHGFPPATEQSFIDAGIDIIRGPGYSGPAIYVNYDIPQLAKPEVRQAMAYVINREQNGFVSLADSGEAVVYMAGMSDALAESWLSEETLDALNTYDQDLDAATALLEGIGFSKGADGMWVDDEGNPLAFELKFPAEFADWAAAAENATEQLNGFGFQITATGVQFQQQQQDVYDGNFEMAIRNWGIASPFPGRSYREPYFRYNGQGELAGEEVGGGMHFDVNVTYSGGTLDVLDAANKAGEGLDQDAQQAIVEQLAVSYNELLPAIPLWERHGNNPLNREFLVAPASDDPDTTNPWGNAEDGFIPFWILMGKIGPA